MLGCDGSGRRTIGSGSSRLLKRTGSARGSLRRRTVSGTTAVRTERQNVPRILPERQTDGRSQGHHRSRSPEVAAVIKNERQYRITRAQAEKFEHAIAELVSTPDTLGMQPVLKEARIDALRSQLGDLKADLEEYQALRSGKRQVLKLDSFDDLPRALVQGRIAAGLSQQELAAKLGIKEQQVQRYEASDYQSASLARVAEVVRALGLRIRKDVLLPSGIAGQQCGPSK